MTMRTILAGLTAFLLFVLPAGAQTALHVSPEGHPQADGTPERPYALGDAWWAAQPGDTLLLANGSYGGWQWKAGGGQPGQPVTLRSLNGKGAHFEWISLHWKASHVRLQNLSVWPTAAPEGRPTGSLVFAQNDIQDIHVEGLDIRGRADAPSGLFGWSVQDWQGVPLGINLRSPDSRIAGNTITGAAFAIQSLGNDTEIVNNTIRGFRGDGIRPIGDRTRVMGNRITDAFTINDGNHDDAIQSWQNGDGANTGLVIEGNTIISWTGPAGHPLRSLDMQGIGLFDGFFDDLVIRNNIVANTHVWGIAVYGGRNAIVSHNTVVDLDGAKWKPVIGINNHKNGTPPSNVVAANNLFMGTFSNAPEGAVAWLSNSAIGDPAQVFENAAARDYRPRADSGFIDTANPVYAAATDVFGNARPQGNGPDRGAIELGGAGGGEETPAGEAPAPEEPAPEEPPAEEPAQPQEPPAEEGGTGDGGTPDGGSTGDGSGDTGGTDGSTEPAPSPGPKFEKAPKKDNPNKGKGAGKQALKAEKAARREARRIAKAEAKAEARAARPAAPVVSTKAPVLIGVSQDSVGFWR